MTKSNPIKCENNKKTDKNTYVLVLFYDICMNIVYMSMCILKYLSRDL